MSELVTQTQPYPISARVAGGSCGTVRWLRVTTARARFGVVTSRLKSAAIEHLGA
jgi:hypothetical protein